MSRLIIRIAAIMLIGLGGMLLIGAAMTTSVTVAVVITICGITASIAVPIALVHESTSASGLCTPSRRQTITGTNTGRNQHCDIPLTDYDADILEQVDKFLSEIGDKESVR
jgi:hypothetical protein